MSEKGTARTKHGRFALAKVTAGLVVLLMLGVMASSALADGDPFSALAVLTSSTTTTSDTTGASTDATTSTSTDATTSTEVTTTADVPTTTALAPTTDATTTTAATTTTTAATTTTTSSAPPASYIVAFADGVSDADQRAEIVAAGGTPGDSTPVLSLYQATFPSDTAAADVAALKQNTNVSSVDEDLSRDTAGIPNDAQYGSQWALPQIGWDNVYGSLNPAGSATVAILDTGVDASHPDLAGAVVPGKNIITNAGDGESDPNGHGTAMAGIVAAATNNGEGIAGVGFAGVKVMPVTVLGADGTGQDSDVINGVVYAVGHGANVILMSFTNPGYSSSLQKAIDYAWSHNVVVVAAVGNDGAGAINYPAGDRGVVGVASTGLGDIPSSFSNSGPDVFLAAPGDAILTTSAGGGYGSISGTSASAAIVAGAAALMRAADPAASNGVIVNRLAESADAAGTSTQTGNGRVNLDRAVSDASTGSIEPAGAGASGGPFVGPYSIASTTTVSGVVSSSATANPISGATVTVTCASCSTNPVAVTYPPLNGGTTGSTGQYASTPNWGGSSASVTVQASAPGFATASQTFTVTNGGTNTKNFSLTPTTTPGTISINNIPASATYGGSFAPTYTSNSDGAKSTASLTTTVCTVSAGVVSYVGAGTCTLQASVGAGTSWTAATGSQQSFTVGKAALSVTADANPSTAAIDHFSKTYGNANPAFTVRYSGFVNSDTASSLGGSLGYSTAADASSSVGAYAVTPSGLTSTNYTITFVAGTLDINAKSVTITPDSGQSKVYGASDPALSFTNNGGLVAGAFSGALARAAGENVGAYAINLGSLSAGGNYSLALSSTSVNFAISAKTVHGSFTASNKVYDGDGSASISGRSLTAADIVGSDDVTLAGGSAIFASADVGSGKVVTGTGFTLSGGKAGNYVLASTTLTTTADISAKTVHGSFTASDKVYDGDGSATISGRSLAAADIVGSDDVSLAGGSASFASADVGSGKVVTGSGFTLSGAKAGNYVLASTTLTTTADITAKTVHGSFTASNKVYDGNSSASISGRSLTTADIVGSDDVSLAGGSATFADKNVGTGKMVTGTGFTLSGAAAGNYVLASTTLTTTADIAKAVLTVTANAQSRQYSDPNPSFSFAYSGFQGADTSVNLGTVPSCGTSAGVTTGTGTYDITCSGGADGNYSFSYVRGTLTITQEDARAFYTGSSLFFGGTITASSATATLAATVKDITNVDPTQSAPAPADTYPGDITTSKVTFVDRGTGLALAGCANLVPAAVAGTGNQVGTVTCQTSLSISSSGGSPYEIGIIVGTAGNYTRSSGDDDTTIVVADPLTSSFITGGGYLLNPTNTAGQYAGDAGRKTNFGFNVKYNKSGTNLQGNVNIIIRKGAKVYQFKSNSLSSLAAQYCKADASGNITAGSCGAAPTGSCTTNATITCPITATFQGKANMNDVTLPTAVSMGGNLTLQMQLTDRGEPGSADSMAISVTDGTSAMLFSSKWDGTRTVEKVMDGGNIVAH